MKMQEMKSAIENKIQVLMSIGYNRKQAEAKIEKSLKRVIEGKKNISDIIK